MKFITKLKRLSSKERVEYIWDYYRWHILAIIFAVYLLVTMIIHIMEYKESILDIVMINSNFQSSEQGEKFDDFLLNYGYDLDEYCVNVNSSVRLGVDIEGAYASVSLLAALIDADEADVFFWKDDEFDAYIDDGLLIDLSEFLSQDELEKYKDDFFYTYSDEQKDTYPCAIILKENHPWIVNYGKYNHCYVGVSCNTKSLETARNFIVFLLENN